ncbi:MAG: histidinol-phosphatase [Pseudomonadota bacterium]
MTSPTDPETEAEALLALAHRMADAAGAAALRHFRSPGLATDDKSDGADFDPVTAGDREAEAAMRALLAKERPDDGILGEEEGRTESRSGLTWVLDPIDGTRAFIAGLPTWGVLIALDDGASGRIGIVDQPHIGERYAGTTLGGARASYRCRGEERPMGVRACAGLADAMLFTTAPELFEGGDRDKFEAVRARARLTRYGTDCYAYALVAAGHVDLVIESGLAAYDIAGPAALIQAAGGVVTDWQGGDARWGGRVVAAGDPRVHAEALALLA